MKKLDQVNARRAVLDDLYKVLAFNRYKHGYNQEDNFWWFCTESDEIGFRLHVNAESSTLLEAFTIFITEVEKEYYHLPHIETQPK